MQAIRHRSLAFLLTIVLTFKFTGKIDKVTVELK
jgi:hypothetical protein